MSSAGTTYHRAIGGERERRRARFAARLRRECRNRGCSQVELARAIGRTPAATGALYRGETGASDATVSALAAWAGVTEADVRAWGEA